jgi:hypothetical protein
MPVAAVVLDHASVSVTGTTLVTPNTISAPASGIAFLFYYAVLAATPSPHITSVTGLGGTWTELTHVDTANATRSMTVGILTGCTGSGVLTIVTDQAAVNSNQGYAILHWTGINTTTPYISSNTKSIAVNATSASVTPNALASAENDYVVGTSHGTAENVSPVHGSAIELFDDNLTDNRGLEMNHLVGWTSGAMGCSWTTSGQTGLVGIEVNAAAGGAAAADTPRVAPLPLIPRGRSM